MIKTVYASFGLLCLLLMIGTAGSLEHGNIGFARGIVQCLVFMVLWILFTYKARLFCWQTARKRAGSKSKSPEQLGCLVDWLHSRGCSLDMFLEGLRMWYQLPEPERRRLLRHGQIQGEVGTPRERYRDRPAR